MTTLERIVHDFSESTAAQTDAILKGDAKTGNQNAKRRLRAFRALRSLGDEGRNALLVLLDHARPDVRGMAAAYLLRFRTAEARAVLEGLASGKGLAAFGASETLKRWDEGTWALDPPPGE